MTLIMATKNENPVPFMAVHPGMMIKPELEERKISQKDFAKMLGVQPSHLSEVLSGKRPLTAELAVKIENTIGLPSKVLMIAQSQYECDLEVIRQRGIEEQKAVNELQEYNKVVDVHSLLKVFCLITLSHTAQLKGLKQRCKSNSAAEMQVNFASGNYRRSDRNDIDMRMVNTWAMIARDAARNISVKGTFEPNTIVDLAVKLNSIFTENINTIERVTNTCGQYGIKFVECKNTFGHTKIDGYSYIEDGVPCIIVTNRYNRIDSLAFNVLHELGHLASNPSESHINVENYSKDNPEERQADSFANSILIPAIVWRRSPEARMNAKDIQRKFTAWANQEGINPWIALGRVGYETGIYTFSDPQKTRRIM